MCTEKYKARVLQNKDKGFKHNSVLQITIICITVIQLNMKAELALEISSARRRKLSLTGDQHIDFLLID